MHYDMGSEIKCFHVVMCLKMKYCQGARRHIISQADGISFLQLIIPFLTHYVVYKIMRKDFQSIKILI
jgi:hypothetical protein